MIDMLLDGPKGAPTLLLAHGSGAPMDTPFMNEVTEMIVSENVSVARFEFSFMAGRRTTGKKRPPPKAEKLIDEFLAALKNLKRTSNPPFTFIGGKSLGGRVASMMAQECFDADEISGLVCLGYPFHPPGKPESLRTGHFVNYNCPSLVCQGENDPFGKRPEIEQFELPASMAFHWAPFGNHDLTPPKRSGLTSQDNWSGVSAAVAKFMKNQTL